MLISSLLFVLFMSPPALASRDPCSPESNPKWKPAVEYAAKVSSLRFQIEFNTQILELALRDLLTKIHWDDGGYEAWQEADYAFWRAKNYIETVRGLRDEKQSFMGYLQRANIEWEDWEKKRGNSPVCPY